jgi:FixJ family two-component response regulator
MQAGACGFFVKPFDDDEFLTTVHQALDDATPNNRHSTPVCLEGARK